MNNEELGLSIKRQIDELNRKQQESYEANIFVLDPESVAYFQKVEELQNRCPHEFEDSMCVYCYINEESI